MTPELRGLRVAQWERTRVFHRKGQPIGEFKRAWATACRVAGCPGRLVHDLRRTAVRNMVRAGVSERVAMQLSGHRTRSVFERYNVTSEGDFREAARKLTGIIPGTIQAQPAPTEGDGRRQPAPNHGQDRSENGGTPGRDRTCDLRIRSPSLCPTELRARPVPPEVGVSEGI